MPPRTSAFNFSLFNETSNETYPENVINAAVLAATFFMHFFYLAMFFWMLDSSLLLLYRSVMVFSQMSKWTMFAIGLTVGYVCPLIIAVTTVAATAPGGGYVREDQACWLNWTKSKALLALVIPALAIVVFNILVILVVLYKMLRRRSTNQADEKHALVVILRCVAILSPLFGLTWCLGIGTMVDPTNGGIHIAFAFFNSLQVLAFVFELDTNLELKIEEGNPKHLTQILGVKRKAFYEYLGYVIYREIQSIFSLIINLHIDINNIMV
uniref:G-protein coupled receptors family 2 profile 2 domain-containing protein n=1 Tax=Poecilia reticulata TaxID=8081 RepID=A0A3P9Q614_POERE